MEPPTLPNLLCVDAESNGLYGSIFAIGAILLDPGGRRIATFQGRAPDPSCTEWVQRNVLPALAGMPINYPDECSTRDAFWTWWKDRSVGAWTLADCGAPVEAYLFRQCVQDDPSRAFAGPYPLHDVASFLEAAGVRFDVDGATYAAELLPIPSSLPPKHHPLTDAWVSAACALKALRAVGRYPKEAPVPTFCRGSYTHRVEGRKTAPPSFVDVFGGEYCGRPAACLADWGPRCLTCAALPQEARQDPATIGSMLASALRSGGA